MLPRNTLAALAPLILATAGMLVFFRETLALLARQWLASEDYSYGLLVFPIALALAWSRRKALAKARAAPDWRAISVLLLSVLIFVAGELGAELFTVRFALIVFFIGSVWLLYGARVVRVLRFPLAFLFLMLPLPGMVYRNVTFPLQLVSTKWSVALLQLLGVAVYREGNVIDMGFAQFQVVEACNGLRYILPLFVIGVLVAFSGRKPPWKRVLLVAATIPFAVFANILRIAGTGVISLYWGVSAAEGFFHSFSGFAVFVVCLGLFGLLNLLLKWMPGGSAQPAAKDTARADHGVQPEQGPALRFPWKPLLVVVVLAALAPRAAGYFGEVPPRPLKQPLGTFPLQFEGYTGAASRMEALVWERVGGQDYVMIDFRKAGQAPVDFYAAYYAHQRKAGDFIHSPKLCLPGAGWFIERSGARRIAFDRPVEGVGAELAVNEMVIHKNSARQLVYYWYQGRGRNFTSEYLAKFYMVWDGIWKRRTDGALVRLVMPLAAVDEADCRTRLDAFARAVSRRLGDHLP